MTDEVLARVRATPARRVIALAMIYALGGILVYLAFAAPPQSLGWQAFLVVAGFAALWLAERMRRATAGEVLLTRDALTDGEGEVLCRMDQVVGIDRGMFAFKPSNGFVLRLAAPAPRRWAPGLWWRLGRRVGIGGVVPSGQGKFMAEMIAQLLLQRDGDG